MEFRLGRGAVAERPTRVSPDSQALAYAAGWMFWLTRNTFSGSYVAFDA